MLILHHRFSSGISRTSKRLNAATLLDREESGHGGGTQVAETEERKRGEQGPHRMNYWCIPQMH
jgi:hypothetical protein